MFSTLLMSRHSALLSVMVALCAVSAPVSAGRGSAADDVGIVEGRSIVLDSQTFDKEAKENSGDLVVVFCDDSAKPCKHMIDSFRHLTTIWAGTGQFLEARFGEVNCDRDRDVCDEEVVLEAPSAIHYRNGMRIASWTVEGEGTSMVRQFVGWVKSELAPNVKTGMASDASGFDSGKGAVSPFAFSAPFAGMDHETAAVGGCLVLGAIAIVGWVLVEGFELWPSVKGKKVGVQQDI